MSESNENKNIDPAAVHPAVLKVSGEKTRRWCAAVWSMSPGQKRLFEEIHGLVQGTLLARCMQPPAQYEPPEEAINSFDVVFYDTPTAELTESLKDRGWQKVAIGSAASEEYEQFSIFGEEAERVGRTIPDRPLALWRMPILSDHAPRPGVVRAAADAMANERHGEVWGESPGWFSKVYCDTVRREANVDITPDRKGLALLEATVVGESKGAIRWLDPMTYQAICDFVGVVLRADKGLDVQWGTCPVDKSTGMAPAPLLRSRHGDHPWKTTPVGIDVMRRICVPDQEKFEKPGSILADLIDKYSQRFFD